MILERMEKSQTNTNFRRIPEGAYEVGILAARIVTFNSGATALQIKFDIKQGDFKNYYTEQFKTSTFDNKTYRGILSLFIPDPNNQYYEQQRKRFWRNINAIEEFNAGWTFNGDLENLQNFKGKSAVLLLANRDYTYNGKQGVSVSPHSFLFKYEFDDKGYLEKIAYLNKQLKNKNAAATSSIDVSADDFQEVAFSDDDDLPF